MADVYRGSYQTLAATKSKDGHGGFFRGEIPGKNEHFLYLILYNPTSFVNDGKFHF